MTLTPFEQNIFLALLGMTFTVATIIFLNGRYRGKADSLAEQSQARHSELLDCLDKMDDRLTGIEQRAHTAEIATSELRTTVIGVDAQNGLRGVIRSIDDRLRKLESVRAA